MITIGKAWHRGGSVGEKVTRTLAKLPVPVCIVIVVGEVHQFSLRSECILIDSVSNLAGQTTESGRR